MEKSHHPGIENVVEKLKKNAAALQEAAALPTAQKFDESIERSNTESVKSRRHSETIPKKLHFLRSCQNSIEGAVDIEVSSSSQSTTSERHAQDESGQYLSLIKNDKHLNDSSKSCNISETCLLGDNNNDSRSNNNNIKTLEDKKLLAKREKNLVCEVTAYVKPKTVWRCEVQPIKKPQTTCKPDDASSETKSKIEKQQKPAIDLSGLELLSNSIEQLEQRVGHPEQPQSDTEPAEKLSVRGKVMNQQSENNNNNNNVGNPLGLLCALAEQIMEVDDKAPRKLNLESSEEISQASRLLLNLGRGPNYPEQEGSKRKYIEDDDSHHSKRSKLNNEEQINKNESFPNHNDKMIEDRTGKQQEEILQKRSKEVNENEERTTEIMRKKQQERDVLKSKESIKYNASLPKNKIMEATKRQQEGVSLKSKNIKDILDFSEKEINNKVTSMEDQSLDRDSYSNQRDPKRIKDLQISSNETSVNSQNNAAHINKIGKQDDFSDLQSEVFESKILPDQPASCEIDSQKMSVEERDTHDYKNVRTKLEAKKFIARKGNCENNDDDWPNMNATELDMRVRMADIQRQYREKQRELSKLIPKKDDKKNFGRPRKKSHSSTR